MQMHRHSSRREESFKPNGNTGKGTATPHPHANETSRARASQLQQQQKHSPVSVATLRELIQRMHRSSNCGSEGDDVRWTQRQSCYSYSYSYSNFNFFNRPEREAVSERDVQPWRRVDSLDIDASSSRRYHGHLSRCVKRFHPPKSTGINLNNLQPPPRRLPSQSTQSSETESDADADVSLRRLASRPSNPGTGGRSEEDAAMPPPRIVCVEIIQTAEKGTSPPSRGQLKKVVAECPRRHNSPNCF